MVKNIFENKKGFVTIYTIFALAVILPISLFVSIDMPYMLTMNRKIKNTLDNATSTAITRINEDMISSGVIHINQSDAEQTVKKVIVESLGLNDDLTVNENSLIKEEPKITVTVVNNPDTFPVYETSNGKFKIENPSVIVYGEIPIHTKFIPKAKAVIKYTSISQAKFG